MNSIKFTEKLAVLSDKLSGNKYLQSLTQGVMSMLPVVIIGSFASLLSGLPVGFWQNFIQSTGIAGLLSAVVMATTNMLGVYFAYGIARVFAEKNNIQSKLPGILTIIVYVALLPTTVTEGGATIPDPSYMGTTGMILGILIAFLTVSLFKKIVDAKIVIKMPEGTPDYVSNSFVSLIPGLVIAVVAMVIRGIFALTPWSNAFDCLYHLLQIPLSALMGANVVSNCVITLLSQICWVLGIHPGFLSGATAPILFGLDGMNQAAYAMGEPIPNVIGMSFSYATTIATLYPAFALAVLLFSKSQQMKTVGKISILPAFFGISEPLMFGVPVVMNPMLAIPWIIAPVMNFVLGFIACSTGLVARYAGVIVFNFPMIATGLLNGSVSLAIMEVVLCALDVLLFLPFVKLQDKKYLKLEQECPEA